MRTSASATPRRSTTRRSRSAAATDPAAASARRAPAVTGRVPPHDLDAEAAVLSAIMLDRDALDRVLETLSAEHFYSDANRLIYEACTALAEQGTPIDLVSVAGWLRDRERIRQAGGTTYLAQLVDATPAVAHVAAHARLVREKWRLRRLIATCQQVAAEGYGDCGQVQQFIDGAEQAVYDIARTPEGTTVQVLKDVLTDAFTELRQLAVRGQTITGIPTGFVDLDKKIAGLHDGDLLIVAARPGMGKTALVLNIAVHVAAPRRGRVSEPGGPGEAAAEPSPQELPGHGVVVFSLEMPREQLARRLACASGGVDLAKLRSGHLGPRDWAGLTEAASQLAALPLWIDDSPLVGLLEVRAKVRRLQAELASRPGAEATRLGLVVVDYLQLMKGRAGAASREQEISEISRGLKQLAKELRVPVVALSQLNRGVETRGGKDKRPMLSDLRESGAIEQDADTIIFIYRDDYYHPETSTERGLAELIVAKQRNGPTGKVRVRFRAECTRFENLAPHEYEHFVGLE